MKTFFIADTHFNHRNIIQYCNRPFDSVEEMNEVIINNWNSVVGKDDIVYLLGNFCFGNKETIANFRKQLKGRIYLVKGNHDNYNIKTYYEAGFEKVYDKPIILEDFFILSHKPMFITENMPYVNIYGHVHNDYRYSKICKNSACVSIERWDYYPVDFNQIKELIQQDWKFSK